MRKKRTKLERLKQSKRIKTHTFRSIRRHLVRTGHLPALNKNMEKLFFSKSALNKVRIKLEEIRYVPVDEIFDSASDGDEITITHTIGCPPPTVKSVAV